jgi:hypothetical protein
MYFNLYLHIAQYFLSDGLSSIYGAIGVEHVRVGRVATPRGAPPGGQVPRPLGHLCGGHHFDLRLPRHSW